MTEYTLILTPSEVRALRALVGGTPQHKDSGPGTLWPELGTLWGKLDRAHLRPATEIELEEESYFTADLNEWLEVQA